MDALHLSVDPWLGPENLEMAQSPGSCLVEVVWRGDNYDVCHFDEFWEGGCPRDCDTSVWRWRDGEGVGVP